MSDSGNITVRYLQEYLKQKDYNKDAKMDYFLKLTEELGELAKVIYKNARATSAETIKNTIEEELWDVMYYTLAIANLYDIDMETWIPIKEQINNEKYNQTIKFEPNVVIHQ